MDTITVERSLDRRGKAITTFVVFDVVAELKTMREGEAIELLTDEFEPFLGDIAAWCEATGHSLITSDRTEEGHRFLIEKRTPKAKESALAMVISDPGLEELLSPLAFALAAALEGIGVSLYFQGPAVRVLKKGYQPHLKGWARRPFTRFAASGMTKMGHLPAQDKLRQLRSLGANIYVCGGSMPHFKVSREDLIFDDLEVVEYLTFMSVMEKADIHIYV